MAPGGQSGLRRVPEITLNAGVDTDEVRLHGDKDNPQSILTPSHEREWEHWKEDYRTVGQERNFCFKPLKNIGREMYTVYFPVADTDLTVRKS